MGSTKRLLDALEAFLDFAHTDRTLSIRRLAEHVGLSERQLQRRIRSAIGMSPSAYLRAYRLNRAREKLADGVAIGDVAHAVGFRSHAYFSHCFRRHFGLSPTRFKQLLRRRFTEPAYDVSVPDQN